MIAIIAVHALSLFGGDSYRQASSVGILELLLLQAAKFGTPVFFFISGFLMSEQIATGRDPVAYFGRRLVKVGGPWLFWASLFSLYSLVRWDVSGSPDLFHVLLVRATETLIHSIYWFVPNMLTSMAFLVVCRSFWDRAWFGAILFGISALYGINTHAEWFPSTHSAAFGGFLSFMWLGIRCSRHRDLVLRIAKSIPWPILACSLLVAASCGIGETMWLSSRGAQSALSTLRLSNQMFSLLALIAFTKMNTKVPNFIDCRRETFGIYLIHPFTMIFARGVLNSVHYHFANVSLSSDEHVWSHPWLALFYWTLALTLIFGLALTLSKAIVAVGFGSLVGAAEKARKSDSPLLVLGPKFQTT